MDFYSYTDISLNENSRPTLFTYTLFTDVAKSCWRAASSSSLDYTVSSFSPGLTGALFCISAMDVFLLLVTYYTYLSLRIHIAIYFNANSLLCRKKQQVGHKPDPRCLAL